MANNRKAVDNLHDQLNPYFNTRVNPNWKAIIEAIGESDQDIADLIEEVRKQFFISSAYRPYLDRLAANYKISRPKVVGMDDATLRKYVPILAYQPKQVKSIVDQLLDIFFFKESTTAFTQTSVYGPFIIKDSWDLQYLIDGSNEENIIFSSLDFNDPLNATAEEIVTAINRQAKHSFAVVFSDKVARRDYVRLFTNTIGSKGSIEIKGGRADISLKFPGIVDGAGSGIDTQWTISKIGDTARLTYAGGTGANLFLIEVGDNVVIDMPGNSGTFTILNVNIADSYFDFQNLFATPGSFDHATNPGYYVRFVRPERSVVYTRDNRSVVWEVTPGEIIIEMPSTPPVVRRKLKGSAHLNGPVTNMVTRNSDTSITVDDRANEWPSSGQFVIQHIDEVKCRIITPTVDEVTTQTIDTNFDIDHSRFSYTSKTQVTGGYILSGISPSLPVAAGVQELLIASAQSDSKGVLTITTTTAHRIAAIGSVKVYNVPSPATSLNGIFDVIDVVDDHTFTCQSSSNATAPIGSGNVRIERIGLADAGSPVYLTSSIANSGILGPYMYDTLAPFIVSSYVGTSSQEIRAGNIVLNLQINTPNNIPNEEGYIIFDYGLNSQEGPVRYLYKASSGMIALDPAYVFKYNHSVGTTITAIRRKGAVVMGGLGKEYAFYVSDPAKARQILQDLISQVKSVGLFLKYIIRYPTLYYSEYDVYSETSENEILLGLQS